jgi:hypothetical protein
MKVLESSCAVLKCVPTARTVRQAQPASENGQREPLNFEVGFSIAVCRDPSGDGLTEHIDLSTIVRSGGPFADRQSVELSAVRQLPAMLREVADELESQELAGTAVSAG